MIVEAYLHKDKPSEDNGDNSKNHSWSSVLIVSSVEMPSGLLIQSLLV